MSVLRYLILIASTGWIVSMKARRTSRQYLFSLQSFLLADLHPAGFAPARSRSARAQTRSLVPARAAAPRLPATAPNSPARPAPRVGPHRAATTPALLRL